MKTYVFVPLAMNQTLFYLGLADQLKKEGEEVAFISCHERSCRLLKERGFEVYDFHREKREQQKKGYSEDNFNALLSDLAIEYPNLMMTHEREAYWLDGSTIRHKFYFSLLAFKSIFANLLEQHKQVVLIQELGGFLSVISSFFVARKLGINNYFIEPSFFRGRVFFVKNSFSAIRVPEGASGELEAECVKYLKETKEAGAIVVPSKDRHHYSGVLKKFFNSRNFVRFFQKLVDKYVLKLEEEFQYIGTHLRKNLGAIVNKFKLNSCYSQLPEERFCYFPFHVPADIALTIRSPIYFDQLYVVEQIAKSLPLGVTLCIKEHPAMIGAISAREIKRLLRRNLNVRLLSPSINNYQVLSRTDKLYTINSKSGAEALLFGIPVVVLGDAFYVDAPGVTYMRSLTDLFLRPQEVAGELKTPAGLEEYYSKVWRLSFPGDLYALGEDNFRKFCVGIRRLS